MTGMHTGTKSGSARARSRAAAVVVGVLVLAACGGGSDSSAGDSDGGETNAARVDGDVAAPSPAADEVAVRPEADIASNLLPDLVVDNLTTATKVNLRNIVPNDRPVLLWMWAPW